MKEIEVYNHGIWIPKERLESAIRIQERNATPYMEGRVSAYKDLLSMIESEEKKRKKDGIPPMPSVTK